MLLSQVHFVNSQTLEVSMKGNYEILGIVVFCFFLFPFFFGKYSPPDHGVLLLSESDGEQIYPGNQRLFFLFLFCCTSDVLLVKMLTFDKLYVNNQMVVLCTKFCFDLFFLLIKEENVYFEGIKP